RRRLRPCARRSGRGSHRRRPRLPRQRDLPRGDRAARRRVDRARSDPQAALAPEPDLPAMRWLVAAAIASAVAGCGGARPLPEPRAYLVRATPESHEAVIRAVQEALSVPHVSLAPDVLS